MLRVWLILSAISFVYCQSECPNFSSYENVNSLQPVINFLLYTTLDVLNYDVALMKWLSGPLIDRKSHFIDLASSKTIMFSLSDEIFLCLRTSTELSSLYTLPQLLSTVRESHIRSTRTVLQLAMSSHRIVACRLQISALVQPNSVIP